MARAALASTAAPHWPSGRIAECQRGVALLDLARKHFRTAERSAAATRVRFSVAICSLLAHVPPAPAQRRRRMPIVCATRMPGGGHTKSAASAPDFHRRLAPSRQSARRQANFPHLHGRTSAWRCARCRAAWQSRDAVQSRVAVWQLLRLAVKARRRKQGATERAC